MIARSLLICSLPVIAAGLAICLPLSAKAAPDPACEPMFNAITKLLQTPNHQYMSQNSETEAVKNGGKLRSSESISTPDASYVKINDQWRKVPISAADMLKQQQGARENSTETCRFVRDDKAEGDSAVYAAHSETTMGKSDIQIWISKASGLPQREEIDLELGDNGKSHSSVRFDYEHIELPKDAKVDPRDTAQ